MRLVHCSIYGVIPPLSNMHILLRCTSIQSHANPGVDTNESAIWFESPSVAIWTVAGLLVRTRV